MRGTNFEFHHRFWFIMLVFFLAFASYWIEPVNSVEWMLKKLWHSGSIISALPFAVEVHAIFAVGAIFIGLAAWVRTWGTAYLTKEVVQDTAIHGDRLMADGPYRYVRNPLYFGSMLLALGFAPMAPPIGALVLILGMGVVVLRLITREEAFLSEKQGESYRAYLARVPRLWPAFRPRVPAGGAAPHWGQAFIGEGWMWIFFAGAGIFAFTFNVKFFDAFMWSGLALYFIFRLARRLRHERRPA